MVQDARKRRLNNHDALFGPVAYWMQRDQRIEDNWALLYVQEQALLKKVPLFVVFNLVTNFGKASLRQYDFMLQGLEEVASGLRKLNVNFVVLCGNPTETIPNFVEEFKVGELVTDFNPLSLPRQWKEQVSKKLKIAFTEIDAHNIVPAWIVSDKVEFAAYTFRPKIHRKLSEFLINFPKVINHPFGKVAASGPDFAALREKITVNRSVAPVIWLKAGPLAAQKHLKQFIATKLDTYAEKRNNPNLDGISHFSPYLHYGQISAQHIALAVQKETDANKDSRDVFLEELIVRRELADNYCFYNPKYNQVAGAHAWAQKTITEHDNDKREYIYTLEQLEAGMTHDELWNAMQNQMVLEGKMHGWCRMYWAKKIKEWTPDAQIAIDYALYLNDAYELDGNDPNGVVGVMWSICGVHDRAWNEREIFGKIRYMNFAGAKRKFNIKEYIDKYTKSKSLF